VPGSRAITAWGFPTETGVNSSRVPFTSSASEGATSTGAHVHLDLETTAHPRSDLALVHGDRDLIGAAAAGKPPPSDARPVAGQLGGRPVGVPDDDLRPWALALSTSRTPSEPTPKW
jgi:hypothetical protein